MTPNELILRDICDVLAKKDITTIPVHGKRPCIMAWNNLSIIDENTSVDSIWASSPSTATGIGVLLGNGLGCIDIDSNDKEIVERIISAFSAKYIKIGRKGCTIFFHYDWTPEKQILNFKIPSGGAVEVFFGNKQTVIPPSWHSEDHYYYWLNEGCTLLTVDMISDLPLFKKEQIDNIGALVGSASTQTANTNLPKNIQYDENGIADGRHQTIEAFLGSMLVKENYSIRLSDVVEKLLIFDSVNFPNNSYFLYVFNSKHKEIKEYQPRGRNALRWVSNYLDNSIGKRNSINYQEEASSVVGINSITFRELVPIVRKDESARDFDTNWVPPFLREMVTVGAQSNGVSLQSVFYPVLGALASCLQGNVVIRPKKDSMYFQRPNLPIVLLAHSGSRKTDINKIAMFRVKKLYSEMKSSNSQELLDRQSNYSDRIIALTKDKKNHASKGEFLECDEISTAIRDLQDKLDALLKEIKPHIWLYKVASAQKIIKDHSMSTKKGLMFTGDEFGSYIALMNKKGNEEFRPYMMECFNGDDMYESSTLSRGTDLVSPCYASMLTTLQPDVLRVKIADMFNPSKVENDGFWTRLVFILMGKPTLNRVGEFNPNNFLSEYSLFDQAFNLSEREVNVSNDDMVHYDNALIKIELRASEYWGTPIGSFLSKHQGRLCKYAYIAEFILTKGRVVSITKEAIEYAMIWLDFESEQLLDIFNISTEKEKICELLRLIELIQSGILPDGETVSKWHQIARGSFKSLDYFVGHLKTLDVHGYISMVDLKANSKIIKVNPIIWT